MTWYRAILYALPDAVLLVEDGRCIDGNTAAGRLFGLAGREEVIGRDISWFSPPRQPDGRASGEAIHACILDAIRGRPGRFAWQCRRADGTTFDAEIALAAARIDDAVVILASIRDSSRENLLLAGARAAEWRAEMVIQGNPMPLVIWDLAMTLRAVNKAFLQMTGYERKTLESMSVHDFESLDRTARKIADATLEGQTVLEEVTLDLPAGTRTLIRYSTPLVDGDGNVIEILTVYRDITP
ncbi:MAG: PAS domain-containing protein [Methanoculleus sp.]|uniref:PAS domain-containing protein n=2 Tax=Methanoculleus TaxID=45989 RepID=UPI0025E65A7E|nr:MULTISPECIES: PAS domain-containing protein [unclassified Methanoculleus]MCK9318664.1 PAS domain-containing protein [Methanoculleus sp.]MDD3215991.1 PAS domain-containing protein [Methanoculleus sp.]HOI57714.1 PAS domain-containing protein [Methanoculleus sp.]